MTQKTAFILIKILEILAFKKSKKQKVNNYSLIFVSTTAFNDYKLTLFADWLYELRHKEVLSDIFSMMYEYKKKYTNFPNFSSISIEREKMGNKDIDELVATSKNLYDYSGFYTAKGYFYPVNNLHLMGDDVEDGFILQSKVLHDFEFGVECYISIRNRNWEKLTPIYFENNQICFLNPIGRPLLENAGTLQNFDYAMLNQDNSLWINIFDVFEVSLQNPLQPSGFRI